MAISEVKVHPGIGIARVGNSPEEFFIGPETADLPGIPSGGYKDDECRVRRQAARFRVFAHHDDGSPPEELTTADAEITWRVKLRNRKAAQPGRNSGVSGSDRDGLVLTAGERSVTGPNQVAELDDASFQLPGHPAEPVPLGEMRTDPESRLLVLGGFGRSSSPSGASLFGLYNDEWYDDVADGYVEATVTLDGTGETFEAVSGWVVVGPPNFAPTVRPPVTLYDRLYDYYRTNGLFGLDIPDPVSFLRHIHPVLHSAREHRGVHEGAGSAHFTMEDSDFPLSSGAKAAVVSRLKQEPGGDMPRWNGLELTDTQYVMMQRWRDDHATYVDDWDPDPDDLPLTPEELDRGPLSHAVGGSFAPGIEAGGYLVGGTDRYMEPFRLDPDVVSPGDVTSTMSLPWQADFLACGHEWWPAQRPNEVVPSPGAAYEDWNRGVTSSRDMADYWHTLGFVVPQGGDLLEAERCEAPSVVLLTPSLDFADVQQGPGGTARSRALAIVFEVLSPDDPVTLEILPGAGTGPFSRITVGEQTFGPTGPDTPVEARLWMRYTSESPGSSATATATVRHVETGREWQVDLQGNTVARETSAVSLVLDRSGSMDESRGDGGRKIDSLKEAAGIFVDVALEGDGIGCVAYNHDVQDDLSVTTLGPSSDPFGTGRVTVKNFVDGLSPGGATSIGDGLFRGRQILDAASGFDRDAMIVVTDGKENEERWISDVASTIDATTYAVGIGRADNVNASTLQTLSGNRGGYLLVTGPITGDNRFVLTKYFLQLLAGISNAEIVLDPDGRLAPERTVRIPFRMTDADRMVDVVLLSPYHRVVDFQVESPLGHRISPATAAGEPGVEHVAGRRVRYYRVRLPVRLERDRASHAGQWNAVLSLSRKGKQGRDVPTLSAAAVEPVAAAEGDGDLARGLPYSVQVQTYSDVSMDAGLEPAAAEPGETVRLTVALAQYGVPVTGPASARADVERPDGATRTVTLDRVADGAFRGGFTAVAPGVHRVRIRATGRTLRGWQFDRERTLTAAVARPDDRRTAPDPDTRRRRERDRALCSLLRCLASESLRGEARRRVEKLGVDPDRLEGCLEAWCRRLERTPLDAEADRERGRTDDLRGLPDLGDLDRRRLEEIARILRRQLGE